MPDHRLHNVIKRTGLIYDPRGDDVKLTAVRYGTANDGPVPGDRRVYVQLSPAMYGLLGEPASLHVIIEHGDRIEKFNADESESGCGDPESHSAIQCPVPRARIDISTAADQEPVFVDGPRLRYGAPTSRPSTREWALQLVAAAYADTRLGQDAQRELDQAAEKRAYVLAHPESEHIAAEEQTWLGSSVSTAHLTTETCDRCGTQTLPDDTPGSVLVSSGNLALIRCDKRDPDCSRRIVCPSGFTCSDQRCRFTHPVPPPRTRTKTWIVADTLKHTHTIRRLLDVDTRDTILATPDSQAISALRGPHYVPGDTLVVAGGCLTDEVRASLELARWPDELIVET